jgi:hypothetical protein
MAFRQVGQVGIQTTDALIPSMMYRLSTYLTTEKNV